MFSTYFIFRQQENLVDNQKCQAGFRPLCNKIPILHVLSATSAEITIVINEQNVSFYGTSIYEKFRVVLTADFSL